MADTLKVRISLEGGQAIRTELDALGKVGEAAFRKLQDAAAGVGRGGFLSGLSSGIAGLKSAFGVLAEGAKDIKTHLEAVGTAGDKVGSAFRKSRTDLLLLSAAVSGAVIGFVALAKGAADAQREIEEGAKVFGITTAAYQKFTDVIKLTGGDTSLLNKILLRFEEGLIKSGGAAKTAGTQVQTAFNDATKALFAARNAAAHAFDPKDLAAALSGAKTATTTVIDGVAKAQAAFDKARAALDRTKISSDTVSNSLLQGLAGRPIQDQLQIVAVRIAAIQDPLKRLAALTALGFDKRTAVQAEEFFLKLAKGVGSVLPPLTELQLAAGVKISEAIGRVVSIDFPRLKAAIVDTFAAPIRIAFDEIGNVLLNNEAKILAFTKSLADKVVPVIVDIFTLLAGGGDDLIQTKGLLKFRDAVIEVAAAVQTAFTEVIKPAFDAVHVAADIVAAAINNLLGTKLTGDALLVVAAIGTVTGAFTLLIATLGLVFTLVGLLGAPWVLLGAAITAVAVLLIALWPQIRANLAATVAFVGAKVQSLSDWFDKTGAAIRGILDDIDNAIRNAFSSAISFVEDKFTGLVGFVQGIANSIIDAVRRAAAAVASLVGLGSKAATTGAGGLPAPGGGAPALAGGGMVFGPGTATSDSILARLSNGEFVVQAAAVRRFGLDFLQAINSMRLPQGGFSLGGLADGINRSLAIPRFATGGLAALGPAAPSLRPFNLNIGGETFSGLLAPEDVASSLMRYASHRSLCRAGAKPSWV